MKWCLRRNILLFLQDDVAGSPRRRLLRMPVALSKTCVKRQKSFQRETIRRALAQNNHSWAASARALETDVANLHRLAKRLGLKD